MTIELEGTIVKREISLGWSEIDAYIPFALPPPGQQVSNFKTSLFYDGSTRILMNMPTDKGKKT